jgi:hypothetical protein
MQFILTLSEPGCLKAKGCMLRDPEKMDVGR